MLRIGLTGGIGSGKSTVADEFRRLGVPVIDADIIAHELTENGSSAVQEIVAALGEGILDSRGRLDRPALRRQVFGDEAKRRQLESILHPRIRQAMLEQAAMHVDAPYVIMVIPLLIETGLTGLVHRILVIDLPEELQQRRARERDGVPPGDIRRIMDAQCSRETRLASADDIIDNSGDPASLKPQVETLHRRYLELAATRPA